MNVKSLGALGRIIDPRYPTNLAIAILTVLATVGLAVWRLLAGEALWASLWWGVQGGLTLFLAWALGREVDPDHDLSAFGGAALALAAFLMLGEPSLLVVFWMLLAVRTLNRTTGLAAGVVESLGLFALGMWLTWQGHWLLGLLTVAVFLLDGLMPTANPNQRFYAAVTFLVTVILMIVRGNAASSIGWSTPFLVAALAISGLFLVVIFTSGRIRSVGDATGLPLSARRVQAGQAVVLLAAWAGALGQGDVGLVAMGVTWAAMLGAAVFRLGLLSRGAMASGTRR